jgi:hypothetical protein
MLGEWRLWGEKLPLRKVRFVNGVAPEIYLKSCLVTDGSRWIAEVQTGVSGGAD